MTCEHKQALTIAPCILWCQSCGAVTDTQLADPWILPSQAFGIIVFDLDGGDAAYHFVDKERWEQIVAVHAAIDESDRRWESKLADDIGWLTADDRPETARPPEAPDRLGRLLKTAYTQTFVLERVADVRGELLGILTLP